MSHLSIELQENDAHVVLTAEGEIDLASAPDLESKLSECLQAASSIVDLSGVSFIDSTGLRVLLTAHEQSEAKHRKLKLVVMEGPVTRLLSLTGVDGHLHTYSSVGAALADA